jgi:hypothetical protein
LDGMRNFLTSCAGIKTVAELITDCSIPEHELFDFMEFLLTKKALALHL